MSAAQVDVLIGGLWQMSSTVISSAGSCLLVDPGYFPRELAQIEALACSRGEVQGMAYTHAHWDHVLGHLTFSDAPLWVSQVLAREIREQGELATVSLKKARRFDSRHYIPRAHPYQWPKTIHGLADGEQLLIGDLMIQALHLPGHSRDSMGLLVEDECVLVVGDYLSPCEIPIIDNFQDYYHTLHRLIGLLDSAVQEVIPGHGQRMPAKQARQIASDDLAYLYQLMHFRDSGNLAGLRYMLLPRASDEIGMREHHLDNCRKLGVDFNAGDDGNTAR